LFGAFLCGVAIVSIRERREWNAGCFVQRLGEPITKRAITASTVQTWAESIGIGGRA